MQRAAVETQPPRSRTAGPDRRAGVHADRARRGRDRVALRTRGGEREITWAEYGELVDRFALGLRGAGCGPRRRRGADADQPARVPHRRHGLHLPRRHAVLALRNADARADRLPAVRLGSAASWSPSRSSSSVFWQARALHPALETVVVVEPPDGAAGRDRFRRTCSRPAATRRRSSARARRSSPTTC